MPVLARTVTITNKEILLNNESVFTESNTLDADTVYRHFALSYPKFFKMDILCKWSWLAAELLLKKGDGYLYEPYNKEHIAVVLCTRSGCIDVDHKYQQSRESYPSPALFVYTLPNIMLGEISIRHGFKGEQLCMMQEKFDKKELLLYVQDLFDNRDTEACICGWIDADGKDVSAEFYWIK